MMIGIAATVIETVSILLDFFDDASDTAVKQVELKKGGIYDVAYENSGAIFESRVKIIRIEKCHEANDTRCNSIVRESIGMHGNVYPNKSNFMNSLPMQSKIKLIVDTSETFDGNIETIMLDSLRDCNSVDTTGGVL